MKLHQFNWYATICMLFILCWCLCFLKYKLAGKFASRLLLRFPLVTFPTRRLSGQLVSSPSCNVLIKGKVCLLTAQVFYAGQQTLRWIRRLNVEILRSRFWKDVQLSQLFSITRPLALRPCFGIETMPCIQKVWKTTALNHWNLLPFDVGIKQT